MTDYTIPEIDYTEKALGRLTFDLQKENFEKFVSIYSDELQLLEETLLILAQQKDIDVASGVWLDYIGKIVGELRNGKSDEDYRKALKLRIGINNSDGTPNIITDLVKQYTNASEVRFSEGGIAWFSIYTNGLENLDATLWQLLQDIKPVATKVIINTDITNNCFRPAWEVLTSEAENFQVTADGVVYENFQVTDNGVDYEDWFVVRQGQTYLQGSTDRSIPAWESLLQPLEVTVDGITQPLEVTVGGVTQQLYVSGPTTLNAQAGESFMQAGELLAQAGNSTEVIIVDKKIPLCWEVWDTSVSPL